MRKKIIIFTVFILVCIVSPIILNGVINFNAETLIKSFLKDQALGSSVDTVNCSVLLNDKCDAYGFTVGNDKIKKISFGGIRAILNLLREKNISGKYECSIELEGLIEKNTGKTPLSVFANNIELASILGKNNAANIQNDIQLGIFIVSDFKQTKIENTIKIKAGVKDFPVKTDMELLVDINMPIENIKRNSTNPTMLINLLNTVIPKSGTLSIAWNENIMSQFVYNMYKIESEKRNLKTAVEWREFNQESFARFIPDVKNTLGNQMLTVDEISIIGKNAFSGINDEALNTILDNNPMPMLINQANGKTIMQKLFERNEKITIFATNLTKLPLLEILSDLSNIFSEGVQSRNFQMSIR